MKVIVTKSYEESCRIAADMIRDEVAQNPATKLGLATGSTPIPVYYHLVEMFQKGEVDFSEVHTVNLDEYWGLSPDHPQSYHYFMQENLFSHINLNPQNTYVPKGTGDAAQNTAELTQKVYEGGVPSIQLLGIGANGHLGFNEAGPTLVANAHMQALTQSTIDANSRFFEAKDKVPTLAITMGMREILAAKTPLLIATGAAKAQAMHGLLVGDEITTQNPSTFLKLHTGTVVIIDEELAIMSGAK